METNVFCNLRQKIFRLQQISSYMTIVGVLSNHQIKQSELIAEINNKSMEDTTMTNTVMNTNKKETKVTETKVCAILHSITTVLWLFNAGMILAGSISSGDKLGWNFWSDMAIAVVFGCCAVEYFLKWKKEKKVETTNTYIA